MAPKFLVLVLALAVAVVSTAEYHRPQRRKSLSRPLFGELDDIDPTSPQQVRIYILPFVISFSSCFFKFVPFFFYISLS